MRSVLAVIMATCCANMFGGHGMQVQQADLAAFAVDP
ncbi:hypothetical protein KPSA3_07658 [Pseudomonas syringae pv. actinidiae]|uniref:Uncharacterized protein n=1 Tax=Pseudomonas syringae pv. actinidiae TaxID=103796 RepID=A0AAN4QEU3_PSESF|nr:hypothetical protein KPSA3_07658 [Pseudomonas syringae pv. actinidiae]